MKTTLNIHDEIRLYVMYKPESSITYEVVRMSNYSE